MNPVRFTFTNIGTDADLSYQAVDSGLKESIVLSSSAAPNTYTFTLSHPGLILKQDKTGSWGFYESQEDPDPVFVIGSLQVYDSSTDAYNMPAMCPGATMTVVPGQDESTITYTVPESWLSDPARKYPVTIDPSVSTSSADTYTCEQYPNNAYGSIYYMSVGDLSGLGWCNGFVNFTLPTDLMNGALVTSAQLSLQQIWQSNSSPQVARISAMTQPWSESSTFNSMGGACWFGSQTVSTNTTSARLKI